MGDINRSESGTDIILRTPALKQHSIKIRVSEKLNLIKQLGVRLEHIQNVEIEQLKLQIATTSVEVDNLKSQLAIDVTDENQT